MQQQDAPHRNNKCVILYVEDSDAMAYLFQRALEHTGADVELFRVADGERALTFLYRRDIFHDAPRPDIVILDLNLPKKSGFEVLEEIGYSNALQELPVVIFSSSSRNADRMRALALGAREFFLSPANWKTLSRRQVYLRFGTSKAIPAPVSGPGGSIHRLPTSCAGHTNQKELVPDHQQDRE